MTHCFRHLNFLCILGPKDAVLKDTPRFISALLPIRPRDEQARVSLVSSLRLWTNILRPTSILSPQAELSQDEEMAIRCSCKRQRGLADKEAAKSRQKSSHGMLFKRKYDL